jgi:hypothetical protein
VTVLEECTASKTNEVQESNLRDLNCIGVAAIDIESAAIYLKWLPVELPENLKRQRRY